VGLLYARQGTPLLPQLQGGGQERSRRSGTENVPYIVGFAHAAELAADELPSRTAHFARHRDRLVEGTLARVPGAALTGHPTERLANNASFVFEHTDGESILLNLDQEGIFASSGSACTAGSLEVSHVLKALGLAPEQAAGSLRLSTGLRTTDDEISAVLDLLPTVVSRVRQVAQVGVR
jgi:cysteine desulfurase